MFVGAWWWEDQYKSYYVHFPLLKTVNYSKRGVLVALGMSDGIAVLQETTNFMSKYIRTGTNLLWVLVLLTNAKKLEHLAA